jgi:hypothetical protein
MYRSVRPDVTGVLTDCDRFLVSTADRRKVRRISENEPLYALTIPSGRRIIDSRVGDDIVAMDLMHRANLGGAEQALGPRVMLRRWPDPRWRVGLV